MKPCIQLVQINHVYLGRHYLPYAAGLLQAYVDQQAPERYQFLPFIYRRELLQVAFDKAIQADIVAFSTYVWNQNYSLTLARALKQARPEILIVMGGPQIPDQADSFLQDYPWVDLVVHGEGEAVFLEILEKSSTREWQEIAGVSYLQQGQLCHQPPRLRERELEQFPSPYLSGLFDDLLRQYNGDHWVALWETNRGCPFTCAYCDWGSATATRVNRFGMERLKAEIDWFGAQQIHMIYCCDANYGILPRDQEITEYMVETRQRCGSPGGFYIQNTKNVTERAYTIQTLISQSGMNKAATLSLQSLNPQALKESQRQNISLDMYRELQVRFRRDGVETYTDILMGLPGETYDSFLAGVGQVIEEGQHNEIRFYNVYLLPNADMAQPAYRERYALNTVWNLYAEATTPKQQEIYEKQEMIIATHSLPVADWQRMRILAWWTRLIYFHHLLQIPMILIHTQTGLGYAEMLQWFAEGTWPQTEVLAQMRQFLQRKVEGLVAGETELAVVPIQYADDAPLVETWISVESYLIIGLTRSQGWSQFFAEAAGVLQAMLDHYDKTLPPGLLSESIQLSYHLLCARRFAQPFSQYVQTNFWQVYQAVLVGQSLDLQAWDGELYRDWQGEPHFQVKLRDREGQPAEAS